MTKVFCDGCGVELIRDYVDERFSPQLQLGGKTVQLEVIVITPPDNLCFDCLKKVFLEGRE